MTLPNRRFLGLEERNKSFKMGILSSVSSRRTSRPQQQNEDLAHLATANRQSTQLPMLNLADNGRNNMVAVIGEFVGTFLFLFWSFAGTQISNTPAPPPGSNPNTSNLLFAALAFGFSLTVNVWAFYRITGGLFNPSVSSHLFVCLCVYPRSIDQLTFCNDR